MLVVKGRARNGLDVPPSAGTPSIRVKAVRCRPQALGWTTGSLRAGSPTGRRRTRRRSGRSARPPRGGAGTRPTFLGARSVTQPDSRSTLRWWLTVGWATSQHAVRSQAQTSSPVASWRRIASRDGSAAPWRSSASGIGGPLHGHYIDIHRYGGNLRDHRHPSIQREARRDDRDHPRGGSRPLRAGRPPGAVRGAAARASPRRSAQASTPRSSRPSCPRPPSSPASAAATRRRSPSSARASASSTSGSGGGIDVLLSAKRVGPDRPRHRARHDRRDAGPRPAQRRRGRRDQRRVPEGHDRGDPAPGRLGRRRDQQLRDQPRRRQAGRVPRDRPGAEAGWPDGHHGHRRGGPPHGRRSAPSAGSYTGCIAGALSFSEFRTGLEAVGLIRRHA